jgi:TRAP-type C4-dicarboxylate transport system permease small subunit
MQQKARVMRVAAGVSFLLFFGLTFWMGLNQHDRFWTVVFGIATLLHFHRFWYYHELYGEAVRRAKDTADSEEDDQSEPWG